MCLSRACGLSLALFLAVLGWLRTDFISLSAVAPPLLEEEEKEPSPEVLSHLEEPYYYLGQGRQAIVFSNQKGDLVLKLFRKRYLEVPWYAFFLPHPEKEREKRALRRKFYEESYRIAEALFPEESKVVYLHLGKTKASFPKATLYTRSSQKICVDLSQTPFVLQKRGEPFLAPLERAIERGDWEALQRRVARFLAYVEKRMDRSIVDFDRDIVHNFGWDGEALFHLDPGRLCHDDRLQEAPFRQEERKKAVRALARWLERRFPEAYREIAGELQ